MSNLGLFGFYELFGFSCSGFMDDSVAYYNIFHKSLCSVCTVDFVEKLWRSLRESLWTNLRKSFHKVNDWMVLHSFGRNYTHFEGFCGKISKWFCTWFDICKNGGFAQFPQGILLQLLNIL